MKVTNFDFIHNSCRGGRLSRFEKEHKAVEKEDFQSYPEKEKYKFVSSVARTERKDLWYQRDLMIEHFLKKGDFDCDFVFRVL